MKILLPFIILFIAGCATSALISENDRTFYKTKIHKHAAYRYENAIAGNIKRECNIGTPLSESVQKNAKNYNIQVDRVDSIANAGTDNYIKLEILSAISKNSGASIGLRHSKMVSIEATIYENGKIAHKINRTRTSKGGFLGGLMSSCDVLERTVDTLGGDIAKLLNRYLQRRTSASAKEQ